MTPQPNSKNPYLPIALSGLTGLKRQSDAALARLSDEEFFRSPDSESNSVAIIVKHLAGNFRSRWTDFLTSDGEKPDRGRDQEFFITESDSRASLMAAWEQGWELFLGAVSQLSEDDLGKTLKIRGESHTVLDAIQRAVQHAAFHVGQIVYLAKLLKGASWESLSIPRGESESYNRSAFAAASKK